MRNCHKRLKFMARTFNKEIQYSASVPPTISIWCPLCQNGGRGNCYINCVYFLFYSYVYDLKLPEIILNYSNS